MSSYVYVCVQVLASGQMLSPVEAARLDALDISVRRAADKAAEDEDLLQVCVRVCACMCVCVRVCMFSVTMYARRYQCVR